MKDKEKQIEEMAKGFNYQCKTSCYKDKCYTRCGTFKVCEMFYNADYRKLPKDSVVMSKEEYERLKRVENEKDRLYEIKLDLENQLIEKGWTDYEGADKIEKRVSKETAREIFNKILDFIHYETFRKGYELKKVESKVQELAKQYGVKIKE